VTEFTHLHVHSQYSLLDGALRVKDLAKQTKALGMRSVALTDHTNMFGVIQLHKACKEHDVAPIIGCEINLARNAGEKAPVDHLVLLAGSEQGYKNLVQIVSAGHVSPSSEEGPSVVLETIVKHREGIIGLTGCMGGALAQRVLEQGETAGGLELERLTAAFEKGSLYVELQDHGLPEQAVLNGVLASLAGRQGLPLVATNDVHFADRKDGPGQLFLGCIAKGGTYAVAHDQHHGSYEMFLKSPGEMAFLFRDYPLAVGNTMAIAERCTGFKLKLGKPMLPKFPVPDGTSAADYFRKVSREGLRQRLAESRSGLDEEVYKKRLEEEMDIIVGMDFPGYFLIVWDFVGYAKRSGIPVGPGRGSGAGSLVAYSLRITDLDPIQYNLLFERFLNPERVSMPDFDIDFCMLKRDAVVDYVSHRYGQESVGKIVTFHEMKAKSVIKDVAKTMRVPALEAQRISNLIPNKGQGVMATIAEALTMEPKLAAMRDSDPMVADILVTAQQLEGLTRHAGLHASGVVISDGPLWDHVPCFKSNELIATQYDMEDVEQAGLVKFDFLGLKTLTVIDIAVDLINRRPDVTEKLDISKLPMDDKATYQLLQSGDAIGVFQLESGGMQQLFRDLHPTAFEDISAAVALYRPGPLGSGMVKDFVDCKHKRKPIASVHPLVDARLKDTYGVIVYQEQVMQVAQDLAGYTLGGADLLRRAMGKKKPEEMAKQRAVFVAGASKNVAAEEANRIFDLLDFFSGYGFNRAHSAGYGMLTYQTAYLKSHYPVEFLCALMTADSDKTEKVVRIIAECRQWGIEILPPEVNESRTAFTVVYGGQDKPGAKKKRYKDPLNPKIRFGLGAVRGIGDVAIEAALEARHHGPFVDMYDFAQRVDSKKVSRTVFEALVQCGGFDKSLAARGVTRAQAFAAVDGALERSKRASKDRKTGQTNMFGIFAAADPEAAATWGSGEYPVIPPWDLRETLARERETLGFYVSGHPLDRYGSSKKSLGVVSTTSCADRELWDRVRLAGMISAYNERTFGNGDRSASFVLEDQSGSIVVRLKNRKIDECAYALQSKDPVLVTGKVMFKQSEDDEDSGHGEPMLLLENAVSYADAIRETTRRVILRVHESSASRVQIEQLKGVLEQSKGQCQVSMVIKLNQGAEAVLSLDKYKVEPSDALLANLERVFGERVVELA